MRAVLYACIAVTLNLACCLKLKNLTPDTLDDFTFEVETPNYQHAIIGSKRCIEDLGCFAVTKDFFHPFYRPVNFLPFDRSTIDTQFLLYTKENPKEPHHIHWNEPSELKDSALDATHRTVFIVHGFFDSRFYGKWMEEVKDNILLHSNNNVIIVDWSKGNGAPYTQAAANSRVVGAELALLIQTLQKVKGISPMDCYIVGHSLGAHIAGYAGERLKKLGRITALDPAQPYFQNMPLSVRLDTTDADFVDVIHTDSASLKFLALGMSQDIGHVDFYPNNGMSQPGCTYSAIHSIFLEGLLDAARRFVSCNHQRAVDFFLYSINYKKALPVAYHCMNWKDYIDGLCGECGKNGTKCAILGFQAEQYKFAKNDSKSVRMYLATSGKAPFWEHTYQIKVKLRKPKTNIEDRKGVMNLQIEGSKYQNVTLQTKTGSLIHGATYSFLVRKQDSFGVIKGVTFSWKSSSWSFFSTHTLHLEYIKIIPMNTNDDKKQKQQTRKFCDKSQEEIKAKKSIALFECK